MTECGRYIGGRAVVRKDEGRSMLAGKGSKVSAFTRRVGAFLGVAVLASAAAVVLPASPASAHETYFSTGLALCSDIPYQGFHSHAHGNAISHPNPGFETYSVTIPAGETFSLSVRAKSVMNAVNGATMYFKIWEPDQTGVLVAAKSAMGLSENSYSTHTWNWTNTTGHTIEGTFGLGLRYGNGWYAMQATIGGAASDDCNRMLVEWIWALLGFRRAPGYYADPVNVATGNFVSEVQDLDFGDRSAIAWTRTYNSRDVEEGWLGKGWSHSFGERLIDHPDGSVELIDGDGRQVVFEPDGLGGWLRPEEVAGELSELVGGERQINWFDGNVTEFDSNGVLTELVRADGEVITITYDGAGKLDSVASDRSLSLDFTYTGDQITEVTASDGRAVSYTYDTTSGYDDVFLDSVTDVFGDTTTYEADELDRIWREIDPAGVVIVDNTYDTFGRVVSQISQADGVSTFTYDSDPLAQHVSTTVHDSTSGTSLVYTHDEAGRLLSIEDPFGNTVERSDHDANGNPETRVDRYGAQYDLGFNDQDQLESMTHPASGTTEVAYDSLHRLESVTEPNGTVEGATTTYTYDGTERHPTTVTNELGQVTSYDVVDELVMSATDADGVVTSYAYWPNRLLKTATQTAAGVALVTNYDYDTQGRLRFVTSPEGHVTETHYDTDGRVDYEISADGGRTDYQYDTAGRLWRITSPELSPTDSRRPLTTLEYYPLTGLLWKEKRPGPGATGLPEAVTTYVYNTAGNVVSVTHPDGTNSASSYSALGRVTSTDDQQQRTTAYDYDVDGNTTTVANQASEVTEATYDTFGRVDLQIDGEGRTTDTNHDQWGRVGEVIEPGGAITSFGYDDLNRTTLVTDARGGETVTTYTPGGRIDLITTPDGVVADHAYDTAGRLSTITRSGSRVTAYEYDKDGRVLTVTSPEGNESVSTYDEVGRVLTSTDPAGVTTTRTWSLAGQLLSEQLEGHGTATFVYDLAGNLASVTDPLGNETTFVSDKMGRRLSRTNELGKTETWTYHADGQVATYSDALVDGQGARTTTYSYDPDTGRMTTVADPSGRTTDLTYNAAGQLIGREASMPGGGGTITDTINHAFDPVSGRLDSMTDGTGTTTYAYNTAGDVLETLAPDGRRTAYAYDQAGRRSSITHPDGTLLDYDYDEVTGLLDSITPRWTLADTFTAANGTAPSPGKWTVSGSGTTVIANNHASRQLTTGTATLAAKVPATADSDLTFTYELPTGATNTATQRVLLRTDQAGTSQYRVDVGSNGTTVDLWRDHPSGNTLVASTARPAGDGPERLRVLVDGTAVKLKVWDPASSEPAGWNIDTTVSGISSAAVPKVQLVHTAGTPIAWIDDVTYLDLDAPPTAAVTYTWDLDDQLIAETLAEGTRTWGYTDGRATSFGQDFTGGAPGQVTFSPTGAEQTWQVPTGVTSITVDMAGGEGGTSSSFGNGLGGFGGRIQATLTVTPGETLYLGAAYMGGSTTGSGSGAGGGHSGGASGGNAPSGFGGAGGGGQSYIKRGGTTNADRVLVAGGGGGGVAFGARAPGGGPVLDDQTDPAPAATNGATGGLLQNGGGGGGGGWMGGSGGGVYAPGTGGTNMAHTGVTSGVTSTANHRAGNGYVTISWVPAQPGDRTTALTYDNSGQLDTETTNGVTTTYDYDNAGQLLSATKPGETRNWTYDALGRWATSSRPDGTRSYTYDDANQLILADCTAGPCSDTSFTYDRAGRRTAADSSTTDHTYSYDPHGRLTGTTVQTGASTVQASRTYDGAGNLTAIALSGATSGSANYTWDRTSLVSRLIELDQGTGPIGTIGDRHHAGTTTSGGAADLTMLDTSWQHDIGDSFDPYGLASVQPDGLGEMGYRGELSVGPIIHLRNRDYDPNTGQFLTTDPLPGIEGTATVANPYHYANNNPITLTDPLGLQPGDDDFKEAKACARVAPVAAVDSPVIPVADAAVGAYCAYRLGPLVFSAVADALGWFFGGGGGTVAEPTPPTPTPGTTTTTMMPVPPRPTTGSSTDCDSPSSSCEEIWVIGESFRGRTGPAAAAFGARAWDGPQPGSSHLETCAANEIWLRAVMSRGARIIDIGIDTSRRDNRSPYYELERRILAESGYPVEGRYWPPSSTSYRGTRVGVCP